MMFQQIHVNKKSGIFEFRSFKLIEYFKQCQSKVFISCDDRLDFVWYFKLFTGFEHCDKKYDSTIG